MEAISDILPVSEVPGCVLPGGAAVCRSVHEKHRSKIRDRVSTPVGICRTGRSVGVHVCACMCDAQRELVCRSSLRAASRMCALGCDH